MWLGLGLESDSIHISSDSSHDDQWLGIGLGLGHLDSDLGLGLDVCDYDSTKNVYYYFIKHKTEEKIAEDKRRNKGMKKKLHSTRKPRGIATPTGIF